MVGENALTLVHGSCSLKGYGLLFNTDFLSVTGVKTIDRFPVDIRTCRYKSNVVKAQTDHDPLVRRLYARIIIIIGTGRMVQYI